MPIRLVDKSVKTPRAATRNLLSGNQETRYSFDSWLLGLLIKTGRQGLVGFVKQPDKPAIIEARKVRLETPSNFGIRLQTTGVSPRQHPQVLPALSEVLRHGLQPIAGSRKALPIPRKPCLVSSGLHETTR
jgi:hypothetical protein